MVILRVVKRRQGCLELGGRQDFGRDARSPRLVDFLENEGKMMGKNDGEQPEILDDLDDL